MQSDNALCPCSDASWFFLLGAKLGQKMRLHAKKEECGMTDPPLL